MQINAVCLTNQRKGGAAVVMGVLYLFLSIYNASCMKQTCPADQWFPHDKDQDNRPGLGIYMWEDGASFQDVVNQEMGDMFPYGMDPTITNDDPMSLDNQIRNQTLPKELKVGNETGFVQDLSPA